ncbi:MAG: ABC transporter permease, partial [Coprobacillus cateniformis]
MKKYILKRIVYAVITIFLLMLLTYFMMHALPGDPFVGEKAVSEATREALRIKYGLDKSVIEQFFMYVMNVFQGDLGTSLGSNRPVLTIVTEAFPYSFELG